MVIKPIQNLQKAERNSEDYIINRGRLYIITDWLSLENHFSNSKNYQKILIFLQIQKINIIKNLLKLLNIKDIHTMVFRHIPREITKNYLFHLLMMLRVVTRKDFSQKKHIKLKNLLVVKRCCVKNIN